MASSKVMSSRSPSNPDLPRQSVVVPSPQLPPPDRGGGVGGVGGSVAFGSMNMDEILKSFYSDSMVKGEMMSEMMSGGSGVENRGPVGMTLEDYLAKAGAVAEEDIRVPMVGGGYGMDGVMVGGVPAAVQFGSAVVKNGGFGVEFGNNGGGGGGRGKRRTVEEVPLDKATQQKQRRMIKNRESAARSRERKQAYTIELESLVTQLEEENARLLKEEEALNKERYKQLMENLVPVTEQRRPPRVLRRTHSMEW